MKKWYQSKTIIVNIIAGILGVIPLVDVNFLTAIGIENVTGYLSVLGVTTTVLNLLLRAVTNTGISSKSFADEIGLPKPTYPKKGA
tara:strand:- start:436 stop:693 length:258 start_codon:yes stop_codon:yes gene_type:complete